MSIESDAKRWREHVIKKKEYMKNYNYRPEVMKRRELYYHEVVKKIIEAGKKALAKQSGKDK